ncbi:hypothetical protein [Niabella hibiscisoli]|uniref:hypothetical protein n=1 Tax=Niabella hibiscisoli TaxID=1825928 RepID=UPI001F11236F|nr:hypothetical protein [Niabella hibiscisoli]MCH5718389.1 hypothetical protein [Niabella hibiscisoli]
MHQSEISRKEFLKKSGLGLAGMAVLPGLSKGTGLIDGQGLKKVKIWQGHIL